MDKQTRQGCRKVSSHGLADPARLQKSKLARISRPGKVAEKKVSSHGLADPARLQEARARWLNELAVQQSKLARVRRPGKKSNLARFSRPGKFARGTSEVARRTCGAGK
ncbi:hypothetical protein CRG98_044982 [Punica granatum]|uniref:Uncharacterized protein n=1 Tax=Punica granatum TaxID=22663 RepID=A0A2I0HTM4_PUNGR|nr:hypothetical protein CRG98_044982 [Punica granatum]